MQLPAGSPSTDINVVLMDSALTPAPLDVLVSTRRVVGRFEELSVEEVRDMFQCAHRVAPVLRREFGASSLTISVQV